jgi:hypothetical protein
MFVSAVQAAHVMKARSVCDRGYGPPYAVAELPIQQELRGGTEQDERCPRLKCS